MNASTPTHATPSRRTFLLGGAAALMSCATSPRANIAQDDIASAPVVVLVALDGVRPEDALGDEMGQLEALSSLRRVGVTFGAPGGPGLFASGPNFVSLPGYTEMLTGASPTSCLDNDCGPIRRDTLLDDFQAACPHDPSSVAALASWPGLSRVCSSRRSGIVSCGTHAGHRRELLEEFDWNPRESQPSRFGNGFRPDSATARIALAFIRKKAPRFLFVSLGETDEYAHRGDIRGYATALRRCDAFIGKVRKHLLEVERMGRRTLLIVTTDHGRAHNFKDHGAAFPESAAGFLIAAGNLCGGLPERGPAHLRDIAPTIRACCGFEDPTRDADGRVLEEIVPLRT